MSKTDAPTGGQSRMQTPPAEVGDLDKPCMEVWTVKKLRRPLSYLEKKLTRMTRRQMIEYLFIPKITIDQVERLCADSPKVGPVSERTAKRVLDIHINKLKENLGNSKDVAAFNQITNFYMNIPNFEPPLNLFQAAVCYFHLLDEDEVNRHSQMISKKYENWSKEDQLEWAYYQALMMAEFTDEAMDLEFIEKWFTK